MLRVAEYHVALCNLKASTASNDELADAAARPRDRCAVAG
jgi:hypothetical protein